MKRIPTKEELYWFERDYVFKRNWNTVDKRYRGSIRKVYHLDWLVPTLYHNGVLDYFKVTRYKDFNSIKLQSRAMYKGKLISVFVFRSSKQCYRLLLEHYRGLVYGSAKTAEKVASWIKLNTPKRINARVYTHKRYKYAKNVKRRLGV